VICGASFLVVFTACGTLFSFGVYQELYESMAGDPGSPFFGASPASIDLIGTLSAAFMTIAAPLATAWTKRFSPRAIIVLGGLLFLLGSLLASFSQSLWQFQLTQGFIMGLGTCFSYLPPVTVSPTWYGRRRGLAMGIILSGTGVGGLVWAPAIQAINARVGYRNGLRISGALAAAIIMPSGLAIDWDVTSKSRIREENARLASRRGSASASVSVWRRLWDIPLIDWHVARTRKFTAQILGGTLQAAAYYTPVFFFSAYARTLGYSPAAGANFIAINNACNAIGKIVIGLLADRWGRLNALFVTTLISALASFAFWLPSTLVPSVMSGRGLFITYSIVYGLFASAYVSLFPASLVETFGPQHFASVNGVFYMARGLATLVGTPSAGALIRSSAQVTMPEGYWRTTVLVGSLLAGASAGVWWVRIEKMRS
jgi:MFS family permease